MSFAVAGQVGARRFNIPGRLDTRDDRDALIAALDELSTEVPTVDLCFYDALTLPASVVDAIAALKGRGVPVRIHVYHNYLAHYLTRLGIPSRIVANVAASDPRGRIEAIAVVGGAERVDAVLALIQGLPDAPVAVFVALQLPTDAEAPLDRLLKAPLEHYRIELPTRLTPIHARTIYIAPPDHHMKVANGLLYLTRDRQMHERRPSFDALFESVAAEYGAGAVGVLLGGSGGDGSAGVCALTEHGACVLAEEGETCEPHHPAQTAPRAGHPTHRLSLGEIGGFLAGALTRGEQMPSLTLVEGFLAAAHARYGYDYRGYQPDTVKRRIRNVMTLLGCRSFFDFQRRVLTDPEVFRRFFLEMSVEVTSFFRHPEQLRLLREEVLPYLDSFPNLRIWSAGCATGEEVFSLAIMLDELGMLAKTRIFATDLNPHALDQAQSGLFPLERLADDRANYLASGGSRTFDDYVENNGLYLKMPERLRERILFHQHSLVQDGVFNEFELILCRNVLIYFRSEEQRRVMARFGDALHPDGFLVLGSREGLLDDESKRIFAPYKGGASRIYRWKK